MSLRILLMAAALPWVMQAMQAAGSFAAAHPIATGATLGAAQGGANGGGIEGALRGAAVGGLGSFAGGALGDALGKIGGSTPSVAEMALQHEASHAVNVAKGAGAAVGGAAAPAIADDIIVTGTRPALTEGIEGGALGAGSAAATPTNPDASPAQPKEATDQNSWGQKAGNTLGKSAVNAALNMMGPNVGAPAGPAGGNASPFVGGGASPVPPAGLSIKGSTAPSIYPWRAAA